MLSRYVRIQIDMKKNIRKAVIASAGFGTRFLPQTKAMPKEMLPLVDKPIIQYVVEELVEAGIQDIIIVTNYGKRSIEDHFDVPNAELASALQKSGKHTQLEKLKRISDMANFVYVRQKKPLGNVAPLYYARHLINNESFIYTYADDLIQADPNRTQQMISHYNKTNSSIVPCIRLTQDEEYERYGVVAGDEESDGLVKMSMIVEKPGKAKAPTNLASVSSYLLTSEILSYVENLVKEQEGKNEEIKIQEAMQRMINDGHSYFAFEVVNAKYYDAGNKLEYLKTTVDFALQHNDVRKDFLKYLHEVVARGDDV
jgi:UTP--glucose-1-phosphate uridylyltransferase